MEVVESSGKFYSIDKDIYESRELYLQRIWFIINNFKYNNSELLYLSKIWINVKYFGMKYPSHIMQLLDKYNNQIDI